MDDTAGQRQDGPEADGESHKVPFFGRRTELAALHTALDDHVGETILVAGPAGMGKSALIDRFIAEAEQREDRFCRAVKLRVTPDEPPATTVGLLISHAEEAVNQSAGFLSVTPAGRRQLTALFGLLPKGDTIRQLMNSLRRRSVRHAREEFQAVLALLSRELPAHARAVFVVDADKSMPTGAADFWRLVAEELPTKIKLVFGLRSDDEVATNRDLHRLDNVRLVPEQGLGKLSDTAIGELLAWAATSTGYPQDRLASALERYDGHPYAMTAALELLKDGLPIDELPDDPAEIAQTQWEQVKHKGSDAIALLEAHAVLEIPGDDELVREVSGLERRTHQSLLADRYIRSILPEYDCRRAIYHAILRDHVLGQLGPDEAKPYHEKVAEVYRRRLADADKQQVAPDPAACIGAFLHLEYVEQPEKAMEVFVNECTSPLVRLGLLDVVERATEEFLDHAPADSEGRSVLFGNLGLVRRTRGDLDGAEEMHRKALEIDEKLGRLEGMASDYGNLGILRFTRGDLDGAEEMYRKALEINEKLGGLEGMASDYGNLGNVMRARGDLEGAEKMYRKALEIDEKLGRLEGMANQYGNLGSVLGTRGDLDGAEAMFHKALEIDEKLGRLEGMAIKYGNLGNVLETRGDLDGAEAMYRKALKINEKLGRLEGMANQYGNLGNVLDTRGDLDGAEAMYRKALKINENLGRLEGMATQYGNLGNVMWPRGDLDGAEAMFHKGLEIDEKLSRLEGMASSYGGLGFVMRARGDGKAARKHWKQARDLFKQLGADHKVEQMQKLLDQLP